MAEPAPDRATDSPPSPPPAAPARRADRADPLAALLVLAFGVVAAGLFALPLNAYDAPGSDVGFIQVRDSAAIVSSSRFGGDQLFSCLAVFWWHWGALVAAAVLLLAVAGAVLTRARAAGWIVAVLAVAAGVLHGLAMAQSADFLSQQEFRRRALGDFYDHAGAGVWTSLVGFGLLAAAGLVRALTPVRR